MRMNAYIFRGKCPCQIFRGRSSKQNWYATLSISRCQSSPRSSHAAMCGEWSLFRWWKAFLQIQFRTEGKKTKYSYVLHGHHNGLVKKTHRIPIGSIRDPRMSAIFEILLPTVSYKETLPQPPTVPMAPRRAETGGTVPMHFRGDEGHPQPSLSENMTRCLGQTCHAMSRNVLNTTYMYIHGIRFFFRTSNPWNHPIHM